MGLTPMMMRMFLALWCIVVVLLLLIDASVGQCVGLYTALNGTDLTKIDRSTGHVEILGRFSRQHHVQSMAYDTFARELYVLVNQRLLGTIDQNSASQTISIEIIGDIGISGLNGLAMNNKGSILYSHSQRERVLYEVNQETGAATRVFATNISNIKHLAHSSFDNLVYATDGKMLFALDKAQYTVRALGEIPKLSSPDRNIAGLFFSAPGHLHGITDSGALYKINVGGGNLTSSIVLEPAATVAGAIGATLTCDTKPPRPPNGSEKWNVLTIIVDDLNDWVGYLGGHPNASTPNIDRLAGRSAIFRNAYAPSSICEASRAATLYSIRPTSSGIYNNDVDWYRGVGHHTNIPAYFQSNGYRTFGAGKIFPSISSSHPVNGPGTWNMYSRYGNLDGQEKDQVCRSGFPKLCNNRFDFGPIPLRESDLIDYGRATWIMDRLGESHSNPFFMVLGLSKPHLDWKVPQEYFDLFPAGEDIALPVTLQNDTVDLPPLGKKLASNGKGDKDLHKIITEANIWKDTIRGYLATVAFMDAQVGRVLRALENSRYAEDTIVVLFSDNGYHFGEKTHWRKATLWERATRIPYLIHIPGHEASSSEGNGQVFVDTPVDLTSFYPTLIDLVGLPRRIDLDGSSVFRLLHYPKARWPTPAIMSYAEHNAVRIFKWRLIQYADLSEEVYFHGKNRHEWVNLATNEKYDKWRDYLREYIPKNQAAPLPKQRTR